MYGTCIRRAAVLGIFLCVAYLLYLDKPFPKLLTPDELNAGEPTWKQNISTGITERNDSILMQFLKPENFSTVRMAQSNNFSLRLFNKARPFVFLHICKTGGTSFSKAIMFIIEKVLGGKYVGKNTGSKHFDWSLIETIPNADVAVMFREPVARAVSDYFYRRRKSGYKKNVLPLATYLENPKEMLKTRFSWQDGNGGVAWLTGTIYGFTEGTRKIQIMTRERVSLNISHSCLVAANRLQSVFWFGIFEDLERSLELLQYQLGLTEKILLPTLNPTKHPKPDENIRNILASLMPKDIWLYRYAKLLFEARWTYYKSGYYKHPTMPPFPTLKNVPCISTSSVILCRKGPLSPLFYVDSRVPLKPEQRLPDHILDSLTLGKNFFTSAVSAVNGQQNLNNKD